MEKIKSLKAKKFISRSVDVNEKKIKDRNVEKYLLQDISGKSLGFHESKVNASLHSIQVIWLIYLEANIFIRSSL